MARTLVLLRAEPDTLLERVAELSRHPHAFRLAVFSAACAHAGLVSLLSDARPTLDSLPSRPATELVIELPEAAPLPRSRVEETPATPESPAAPPPSKQRLPSTAVPQAAAPEAARASAVLSRTEASEQPLDFTDSIVTGSAESYAGGVTRAQGTSARFAHGAGTAPSPQPSQNTASTELTPGPDRSRAPSVVGGLAWNCPFPPAADTDGVDHAQVTLRVEVDARGRPTRVLALSDPGHGFAAAARSCALGKRWSPGADRWGRPSASGINLSVRFVR